MILSLTSLVNTFLNGQISDFARILFFSANLTALRKKDGGIRPIAVGNILRRLASKVANHFACHKVSSLLRPVQLGVSVKNACEAAVHSARIITKLHSSKTGHPKRIQLHTTRYSSAQMLDKLSRDFQTSVISIWLTNSSSSSRKVQLQKSEDKRTALMTNGNLIWSDSGVQHGDPLGPLLFSIAIHDIASSMKSNFNVWYLDDATIAGDQRSVCDDIKRCSCMLADIGLCLNPSKSELANLGLDETVFFRENLCINSTLENVSFVKEDVIPFGPPLTSTAIRPQFQHKLSTFKAMTEKLSLLDRHPAYFLLKNCFSIPILMYLLRNSPTFQHPDIFADFDDCLKSCASDICNVSFDDIGWIQATLPIRLGGIGLRRASDLALPAYLASISASQTLISEITQPDNFPHALDSCHDVWSSTNPSLPENPNLLRQWDDIRSSSRSVALRPLLDQHRLACLSSATQPNSGA